MISSYDQITYFLRILKRNWKKICCFLNIQVLVEQEISKKKTGGFLQYHLFQKNQFL